MRDDSQTWRGESDEGGETGSAVLSRLAGALQATMECPVCKHGP